MKAPILNVLVACEESQTVCKAFRSLGHNAYSCDTQPCSGGYPEWHIQGDALAEAYSGKYDLMIAHPPCTYLSRAGACRMYPTAGNVDNARLLLAKEAKDFFMLLLNAPIKMVAVENPQPLIIVELPAATTYVQPFQHGHPFSKKTLLWLRGLPPIVPTSIISDYRPFLPSNTGGKKRGQKYHFTSLTQKQASKTFPGIAYAMATQWGGITEKADPFLWG